VSTLQTVQREAPCRNVGAPSIVNEVTGLTLVAGTRAFLLTSPSMQWASRMMLLVSCRNEKRRKAGIQAVEDEEHVAEALELLPVSQLQAGLQAG